MKTYIAILSSLLLCACSDGMRKTGGIYEMGNSQVFEAGDIVRYGKNNTVDKENSFSREYKRETLIKDYLNGDTTLLSRDSNSIHSKSIKESDGWNAFVSSEIFERINMYLSINKADVAELEISSGYQISADEGNSLDSIIQRLPKNKIEEIYNDRDYDYMFVTNKYYAGAGKSVRLKGTDFKAASLIDTVLDLKASFKGSFDTSKTDYNPDVPIGYNFRSIDKDKLRKFMTWKNNLRLSLYAGMINDKITFTSDIDKKILGNNFDLALGLSANRLIYNIGETWGLGLSTKLRYFYSRFYGYGGAMVNANAHTDYLYYVKNGEQKRDKNVGADVGFLASLGYQFSTKLSAEIRFYMPSFQLYNRIEKLSEESITIESNPHFFVGFSLDI